MVRVIWFQDAGRSSGQDESQPKGLGVITKGKDIMEACEWKANTVPYWSCVRELNACSICIAVPLSRSWFDASNKDICGNLLIQNTSLHEVRYMNGWMGRLSSGHRASWLNVTGGLLVRSSAPPSVDVSLSKTLGRNCSWRAACHLARLTPLWVCVNRCRSFWIKASAKCPKCKWMPFYFAAKWLSGYMLSFKLYIAKCFVCLDMNSFTTH